MTTQSYKGFRILAMPYQIAQSRRWTVDLEIRRKRLRQAFSLEERYRTEREAEARCVSLGRHIIDGRIRRLSVDHLRPLPTLWGWIPGLSIAVSALRSLAGVQN
jgi:hypothetical protein